MSVGNVAVPAGTSFRPATITGLLGGLVVSRCYAARQDREALERPTLPQVRSAGTQARRNLFDSVLCVGESRQVRDECLAALSSE